MAASAITLGGTGAFAEAPIVTSIQPSSGPPAGGTLIIIEGRNFQPGARVSIGRRSASTVVVESPTRISAMTVSNTLSGAGDVVIVNPDNEVGRLEEAYTYATPQILPARNLRRVFAANHFVLPVLLTHAGDETDRLFIVELAGRIKVLPNKEDEVATYFIDLRDRVDDTGSQAGLLSLAFHPDYRTNGLFYVFYSHGNFFSRLSEFRASADPNVADIDSERIVLEISQTGFHHNGNHLAFGSDGMLYISQGTGGLDEDHANGQKPTNLKGTILRIDVDARSPGLAYGVPPDNPFVGNTQDWREEIWSYGMRNPWRFSFDRGSGLLWEADVGWGLWEEINLVEKGGNYGWITMQGSQCNSSLLRDTAIAGCDREGLSLPVFEYGHSSGAPASITGGYVYRGVRLSGLYGVYLYGDYVSKNVWGLRYENGQVLSNDLLATVPDNVVSFGEDERGEVYILGYKRGGIYAFEPLPGEKQRPTAILAQDHRQPQTSALHQNHPNPFNSSTLIRFTQPFNQPLELAVYNLAGQKVATLVNDTRPADDYTVHWNGRDTEGLALASGIYLYQLRMGTGQVHTRKLVLLR
jgi:glucose/arabinose dehydrogenase